MRTGAAASAVQAIVALACALAALPAAQAQDIRITAPTPTDAPQASQPLTPAESAVLGRALLFDPANLAATKSARPLRLPSLSKPHGLSVNGTENPDGTRKVAVKQPLATDWDASVGADLKTAAPPPTSFEPGKPFPGTVDDHGSGAAWASVGVPNLASVDARVDPTNEQGKLGGTLKHSIPIGKNFSVTVQNTYSVTETFSQPTATAATGASGLPLMAAPMPTTPQPQAQTEVYGNEKSVKFNIQPTGTTLAAGITTASNDPVTHNTLSADQKLFGPLHVTTAVSDIGQPVTNKSITAGFKLNW